MYGVAVISGTIKHCLKFQLQRGLYFGMPKVSQHINFAYRNYLCAYVYHTLLGILLIRYEHQNQLLF